MKSNRFEAMHSLMSNPFVSQVSVTITCGITKKFRATIKEDDTIVFRLETDNFARALDAILAFAQNTLK